MQEIFQLFGELGIRTDSAFRELDSVERRVRDLANQLGQDLFARVNVDDNASGALDNIGDAADNSSQRIAQLQEIARSLRRDFDQELDLNITGDTSYLDGVRNDLDDMVREADRAGRRTRDTLERSLDGIHADVDIDLPSRQEFREYRARLNEELNYQRQSSQYRVEVATDTEGATRQMNRLRNQVRDVRRELGTLSQTDINVGGLRTGVDGLVDSLENMTDELGNIQNQFDSIDPGDLTINPITGEAGNGSRQQEFDSLANQISRLEGSIGLLAAATAAEAAGTAAQGGFGRGHMRNQGYDIERVYRQQMRMNQQMLRYAQRMDPKNTLGRVREKLDVSASVVPHLDRAKTQLELNALTGMIESGAMNARRQLAQIGFGRTKTETKALHAQLYNLANIRMDNLKDQIKLTEKALKDMKGSANADQLVNEIRSAENSLDRYKRKLKEIDQIKVTAKINGLVVRDIDGKKVFVEPWKKNIDKVKGTINQFINHDVGRLMNKAYRTIDDAGKKIVGDFPTKLEQKAKITQLQTQFQMLGMTLNQTVTPAAIAMGVGFAMAGATAEKGWNVMQAQTLKSTESMGEYKDMITDTMVTSGESQEEVGKLYALLENTMGKTKDNIKDAADMGLTFQKVWGVDAAQAVGSVDAIVEELGVTSSQAEDILALAMKRYHGDITKATNSVIDHGDQWVAATEKGEKGAGAYQHMLESIDRGAFDAFAQAAREALAAIIELWDAIEPTMTKIANQVRDVAHAFTEWLRANPGMAKLIAHIAVIGGALAALTAIMMPVAGFLMMYKNVFQALGQGFSTAAKGAAVLNPMAKMTIDNMKLLSNGILGMPRIISSIFPALLGVFKRLPQMALGAVFQFIRLNPLLTAMGAIALVVYKNWDQFEPVLTRIWDAIKRIGDVVLSAFAGPGGDAMDGFGNLMDKVADIAGDILLPAFEALATILEWVATATEEGGSGFIIAAAALMFFGGGLSSIIPTLAGTGGGVGFLSKLIGLLSGNLTLLGPVASSVFGVLTGGLGALPAAASGSLGAVGGAFEMFGIDLQDWADSAMEKVGEKLKDGAKAAGRGALNAMRGAMSGLASMMSGLMPLLMNPYVLLGIAIVAVVAGIIFLVYRYWDEIVAACSAGGKAIASALSSAWSGLASAASTFFTAMVDAVVAIWDGFWQTAKWFWDRFAGMFTGIWNTVKQAALIVWPSIQSALTKIWSSIKGAARSAFNGIRGIITRAWSAVRKATSTAWNGVKRVLSNAWSGLKSIARNGANAVKRIVSNIWQAIKSTTRTIWKGITSVLSSVWGGIRKTASRVFNAIKNTITKIFRSAVNAVVRLAKSMYRGVVTALRTMRDVAIKVVRALYQGVVKIFKTLSKVAVSIVKGLKSAIIKLWQALKNSILSLCKAIYNITRRWFNAAKDAAVRAFKAMRDFVVRMFNAIVAKAKSFVKAFTGALGRAWEWLKGIGKKAWGWGVNVVEGFTNGILGKMKDAIAAAKKMATGVMDVVKDILGIHSPSRMFFQLGGWTGEGFQLGIVDKIKAVGEAGKRLAEAVIPDDLPEMPVPDGDNLPDPLGGVGTSLLSQQILGASGGVSGFNAVGSVTTGGGTVNNVTTTENTSTSKGGVVIQNATFDMPVQQLQNAQDITALRKNIQNVVANDLFGRAVRNL